MKLKHATVALLMIGGGLASSQAAPHASVAAPAGRVVLLTDGNAIDPDDMIGTPVALALLRAAGLENRLVAACHSCELVNKPLFNTDPNGAEEQLWRQEMNQLACDTAASVWGGFDHITFWNARVSAQKASLVTEIKNAINASSASDPLWVIEAGEPDVLYDAIKKDDGTANCDWSKLRYVTVITHHPNNDIASDSPKKDLDQILAINSPNGIRKVAISDQNLNLKTNLSAWYWARDHADSRIQWLYTQGEWTANHAFLYPNFKFVHIADKFDCSDAGMVLYWITGADVSGGKTTGSPTDVQTILEAFVDGGEDPPPSGEGERAVFEAENATLALATVKSNADASGGQYVDPENGAIIRWDVAHALGGTDNLEFRVKVLSNIRSVGVFVNDAKAGVLTCSSTNWETQVVGATLAAGANTIELRDSEGKQEPDVDYLALTVVASSPPPVMYHETALAMSVSSNGATLIDWVPADWALEATTNLTDGAWFEVAHATNRPYEAALEPPVFYRTRSPVDAEAPVVTIKSPAGNASFLPGSPVAVNAKVQDNGVLSHVCLLVDGVPASTNNNPPFEWVLEGLGLGGHTLRVEAVDAWSNTNADEVGIAISSDITPPVVAITAPASGESFNTGVVVNVAATITDNMAVQVGELYVDGSFHSAVATAPYTWTVANLGLGAHTLAVRGVDPSGNAATNSRSITVAAAAAPGGVW